MDTKLSNDQGCRSCKSRDELLLEHYQLIIMITSLTFNLAWYSIKQQKRKISLQ